ncbi:sensor histidine kinase [Chitinophaga nivalis]|uniref:histidine kinase n=1 Tax=Chitinophaga nivalis TaxID=2991709 RepID=A0ABT3IHF4_9BACT|nr:hybrid sensor histidine kinase/response regulator [Chitinophaga nivalis]MCW3466911.1 hybrid sensor histidine kinase/response regulator [Chitinophaga nivalis]MCW3483398.1 hybrid sensor histidine kinase/response regulator [Chitinophaga nivalis]
MKQQQPKAFTILLVDDNTERTIALEQMLDAEEREIIKTSSGAAALDIILSHNNIGLIILNTAIPDLKSPEVQQQLQDHPRIKDIPVLFMLGAAATSPLPGQDIKTGTVDYIILPLHPQLVSAKVKVQEQLYRAQYELKTAVAETEKVNKQLERFMYMVAHDLKSPLSGAIGMLALISDDERIQAAPDLKEYMSIVMGATNSLSEMITAMLDYTRQNEMEHTTEEVNIPALINQLSRLLFLPAHIKIEVADTFPLFHTNQVKLKQVFQNLLTNAIKYINKKEGLITIGGTDRGAYYEFYVKDNGPGVAKRDTDRIFKLFERLDTGGKEEGTGIGLNIFKLLVEEQGGKVWVDSVPGEGSTFYFLWRQ